MFVSSSALKLLTILSTLSVSAAIDADVHQHDIRRLTIASDESIALQIQAAHASGGSSNIFGNDEMPRFKLHAEQSWGTTGDFSVSVKEATPAITAATTTSTNDGPARPVNEQHMATLLVADTSSAEEKNTIAMIAVDKRTGNVNGIVNKGNGENVNFFQMMGAKVRFFKFYCLHVSFVSIALITILDVHNFIHP